MGQGKKERQERGNIAYAFSILWKIDRKYVIHSILVKCAQYFIWVFNSVFFVKYVVEAIENQLPFERVLVAIVIIGLSLLLIHLYNTYVYNVYFPASEPHIFKKLNNTLFRKAENVELECFEDSSFYNDYTLALEEAYNKITSSVAVVGEMIAGVVFGIITTVSMIMIDVWALLFIAFPLIGNFLIGAWQNKYYYARNVDGLLANRKIEYVNRVMYLSDYAKEMRSFNVFNILHRTYSDSVKVLTSVAKKYKNKLIIIGIFHFLFSYTFIFEGLLFYVSYITIAHNKISLSDFAIMTSVMVTASYIWINVMNAVVEANKNGFYINSLRKFLSHEERIPENQDGIIPKNEIDSIEFDNVSFSYRGDEERPILDCVSFKMLNKSSMALVGFNGAGKTTLIKLLLRLYDPTSGRILVNGIDIRKYNLKAYRELFAVAFQDFAIFADSVENNILMGRTLENSQQEIENALKKVGLFDKIDSSTLKIQSHLTKEFHEEGLVLSGGELQKLAVARTMINPAPVKVYDEPTSALDPISENELFECILEDGKKSTTFYISHRLSSTKRADVIMVLKEGKAVEIGSHNELMDLKGEYFHMFEKQAVNYRESLIDEGEEL